KAERGDIVAKIAEHACVARILRILAVEHRQIVEARRADRGHEVRRLVYDAGGGGDIPEPAEGGFAFETVEGDAGRVKVFRHGEAGGAGANDHMLVRTRGGFGHADQGFAGLTARRQLTTSAPRASARALRTVKSTPVCPRSSANPATPPWYPARSRP